MRPAALFLRGPGRVFLRPPEGDASGGPRKAAKLALGRGASADDALALILGAGLAQTAANMAACSRGAGPLGPHQLRVGLRRLRTGFELFADVLPGRAPARFLREARRLGRLAGPTRDLDAVALDVIAPRLAARPEDAGLIALDAALGVRRVAARRALDAGLARLAPRMAMDDLAVWIRARSWRAAGGAWDAPMSARAAPALEAKLEDAMTLGRAIASLDIEARHDLRKRLKGVRYAVEFLRGLYEPADVKPYRRALRDLQDAFGALNDLAVAEAALTEMGDAPGDAHEAAAALIAELDEAAEATWAETRAAWAVFAETPPFWR